VLKEWGVEAIGVVQADALEWLRSRRSAEQASGAATARFDLVFLDPPYAEGLLAQAAALLEESAWLAPGALIYVEHAREGAPPLLPVGWERLKSGTAGAVSYDLWRSVGSSPAAI
jgi:16S rRNA (guanine966-N2)-methyltransferase